MDDIDRTAEAARLNSILKTTHAKQMPALADNLAFETDLGADAALKILTIAANSRAAFTQKGN